MPCYLDNFLCWRLFFFNALLFSSWTKSCNNNLTSLLLTWQNWFINFWRLHFPSLKQNWQFSENFRPREKNKYKFWITTRQCWLLLKEKELIKYDWVLFFGTFCYLWVQGFPFQWRMEIPFWGFPKKPKQRLSKNLILCKVLQKNHLPWWLFTMMMHLYFSLLLS